MSRLVIVFLLAVLVPLFAALNKADLRTNSLGQRAVARYSGAGKCLGVGTAAGTPR